MPLFFIFPFGVSGDLTTIPNDTQPSGSVSYESGFPIDYQKDLATDPLAKPIPRAQFNQLMYDITSNIQEYQTLGTPQFITTGDNEGTPYPYDIFARVRYDDGGGFKTYESLVTANVALPSDLTKWRIISGNEQGVQPGTIIEWAGLRAPAGYLLTDGSAVLRASYPALYSAITDTQNGTTSVGFAQVTGLTNATALYYPGMAVEGAGIPASTTIFSVDSSVQITLSQVATASATVPITIFPFGDGDGSTTFNIPDKRRRVAVGYGGSATSTLGNRVGSIGGEESHTQLETELATHSHTPTGPGTGGTPAFVVDKVAGGILLAGGGSTTTTETATATTGDSTPFNVMQPSIVMFFAIKT